MKSRWYLAGVFFVCAAAAAAQTQQQGQQQTPPPAQPPAQNQAQQTANPSQPPATPATSQPAPQNQTHTAPGQPQGSRASSTPVPDSAKIKPPEEPVRGQVVEEIVARVNNEIITNMDYQHARADAADEVKQGCKGCSQDEIAKEQSDLDKDVLRDLIDNSLMVQRAQDLDISVDADVVKELDRIRQQNDQDNKLPDLEALQKAVESEGIDWEEFKNNIKKHLLVQELERREIAPKLNIDHAQVLAYYNAHKDQFERPEMVYLREILVSTKDKPELEIPKLKAKAEELRQRVLENGDDFGELAKHFSDGSTAKQGGELGAFEPGQLKGDFAQVYQLNAKEMTPVIKTENGFEVLQVEERYEAGLQPLDKVDVEIQNQLTAQLMPAKTREYCNQLRQDSYVWVHPGFVDSAGVASTPIVEEETPVAQKKKDSDSGTATSSSQKKHKFMKIF
jgi:peptidyl-prolyl cis-trans isomerase SurA